MEFVAWNNVLSNYKNLNNFNFIKLQVSHNASASWSIYDNSLRWRVEFYKKKNHSSKEAIFK